MNLYRQVLHHFSEFNLTEHGKQAARPVERSVVLLTGLDLWVVTIEYETVEREKRSNNLEKMCVQTTLWILCLPVELLTENIGTYLRYCPTDKQIV